jgi:hypothetical protein
MKTIKHPNEILITDENRELLFQLADTLGKEYAFALKEQENRQNDRPSLLR